MASEFANEVTKQAVARAALALDFKEAEEGALESLAEVVQEYVRTLGEATRDSAESAGRVCPGIQDAIGALESMKSTTRANWRELSLFAFGKADQGPAGSSQNPVWCQPFPLPVLPFPCQDSNSKIKSSFGQSVTSKEQALPSTLPSHFPPFPPAHTYKKTVTHSSKKRSLEDSNSAMQRAKRLQVAKHVQESITALDEIVDKKVAEPSNGVVDSQQSVRPPTE